MPIGSDYYYGSVVTQSDRIVAYYILVIEMELQKLIDDYEKVTAAKFLITGTAY